MSQTPTVKVAEYRNLLGSLEQALITYRSAATPQECERAADWMRRAGSELLAANCPRASREDRRMAEVLTDRSAGILTGRV